MGSTTHPEELQAFMRLLNTPIVIPRPPDCPAPNTPDRPPSDNMLDGTGIKFMGHIVQRKRVHIRVLLGAEVFAALEDVMTGHGLEFEMDVLGWKRPD